MFLRKLETVNPEKAFDINNGIVLNEEVHEEVHKLILEKDWVTRKLFR
jgi:hypothetical protein